MELLETQKHSVHSDRTAVLQSGALTEYRHTSRQQPGFILFCHQVTH